MAAAKKAAPAAARTTEPEQNPDAEGQDTPDPQPPAEGDSPAGDPPVADPEEPDAGDPDATAGHGCPDPGVCFPGGTDGLHSLACVHGEWVIGE